MDRMDVYVYGSFLFSFHGFHGRPTSPSRRNQGDAAPRGGVADDGGESQGGTDAGSGYLFSSWGGPSP